MPSSESIAIIVRVGYGSIFEQAKFAGMAHLLEHCVLAKTHKRTNFEISKEVDSIGAYLNGHTTKEGTYYEFKGLKKYFKFGMEILSDCLFNCTLDKKTMNGEKKIIYNEINRILDDQEDYIVVEFEKQLFKGNPLEREISGTKKTVKAITQKEMKKAWKENYTTNNMEITIAGNLSEKEALKGLEQYFNKKASSNPNQTLQKNLKFTQKSISLKKPIKQTLYCIGFPTQNLAKQEIYGILLINSLLVDGLSSRLYQEIREKRKLAYFVRSNIGRSNFESYAIVLGTEMKNLAKAKAIIKKELKKLTNQYITKEELLTNKNKTIVELKLLKEDNLNYVRVLSSLFERKITTIDEITKGVQKLTAKQLKKIAKSHFNRKKSTEVEILPT